MKWSRLKAKMYSLFADSVKGRVRLQITGYRNGNSTGSSRFWITFDGKEVFSRHEDWMVHTWDFHELLESYVNTPIDTILGVEYPWLRAFAPLDRRAGKRRLFLLALDSNELGTELLRIRMECEKGDSPSWLWHHSYKVE